MAVKAFLDIHTLIDFFDANRPEHESARQLVELSEANDISAHVSESVLNTVVYILRKEYKTEKMRIMLDHLLMFMKILPCSNAIYSKALQLQSTDLEDAVLYQLATDGRMDFFVTSNQKDFKKFSTSALPVVSAKEMLKILS